MVCAADEDKVDEPGGDRGVPVEEVFEADFSLAEVAGTGSH